jgi:hypothetical protein
MKIVSSRALANVVNQVNRRVLKNHATFYHRTDPMGFLCGMQTATKHGVSGPDFILVTVNQGVFGFDLSVRSESEWIEYLTPFKKS